MNTTPAPFTPRPSPCPGLFRVAPALDGGICRVKLAGGRLSASAARAIARAAEAHASGVLEATNRSNLQLRGVRAGAEQALAEALLAAGVGPRVIAADDVRNVLLSPLADGAVQALGETLLDVLQDEPRFHGLSPKFAVQLDGGEPVAMLEHPNDLWLAAMDDGPAPRFAFGLAGCPPRHAGDAAALAAVPMEAVPALLGALLHAFLDLAADGEVRMRQLLARLPVDNYLTAVQARLPVALQRDAGVRAWRRVAPPAFAQLGVHPQADAAVSRVGAGFPLGRLDAAQLRGLAELAETYADGELRLTPWQGVMFPQVATARAAQLLAALEALGLLSAAEQPLARIVACTGSAACARGLADTKGDALRLAAQLDARIPGVHLSGCIRSCAQAQVAPFTLLAVAAGRYDLYRRAAGLAGFGQPLARNLTLDAAAERLAGAPIDA